MKKWRPGISLSAVVIAAAALALLAAACGGSSSASSGSSPSGGTIVGAGASFPAPHLLEVGPAVQRRSPA